MFLYLNITYTDKTYVMLKNKRMILLQMDAVKLSIFVICMSSLATTSHRSVLDILVRNKRATRNEAFERACSQHDCLNNTCNNADGWYLYGSDWGCCGNYNGCCTWASTLCYAHDVICRCCDYWLFCGPDCRKEPECDGKNETEKYDGKVMNGTDKSNINRIRIKPSMAPSIPKKQVGVSLLHKMRTASKKTSHLPIKGKRKLTKGSTIRPYVKPIVTNVIEEDVNNTVPVYGVMSDQPQVTEESLEGSGET